MGKIVGGFVLPHEPGLFFTPKEAAKPQLLDVHAAYDRVRDRIGELQATTVVVIGADHYVLFGPQCLPNFLIGIGDVTGPYEKFPGVRQDEIPNNRELARQILQHGRAHGFDWSASKSLRVDHSVGLPARICALPNPTVKGVIPVYLASGVEPLIPIRRAYEVGGAIRAAVEAADADERVVVIGSGGISHWVGMPRMGDHNEGFDRMVLDCVVRGDAEPLFALSDAEIIEQAGNGGLEIRNLACAMGALPGRSGALIAYHNEPDWVAGLGFAEIHAAA
ncbi:MAG: protocatechuate 3,4-dioxygenase [Pseudomonadota bacterium]